MLVIRKELDRRNRLYGILGITDIYTIDNSSAQLIHYTDNDYHIQTDIKSLVNIIEELT